VGGAGLAGGAVLWITSPPATGGSPSSARIGVFPALGPGSRALVVRAEF
jgi:hypothetical protein